ncbi:unnamed protein product [Chilo suppressalis]|uniref:Peptidase S1 domain-containing protein n=1 Tax=Chilo suppressalis TaxID=168631 RepID=A0ABN8AYI1_CHISP|nr:unnamed protein product [Chilo suppressalis]
MLTEILLYLLIPNLSRPQLNRDLRLVNDQVKEVQDIQPLLSHLESRNDRKDLVIPNDLKEIYNQPSKNYNFYDEKMVMKETHKIPYKEDDFKFSTEVSDVWQDTTTITQELTSTQTEKNNIIFTENLSSKINENTTEDICTYLKKTKCNENNGLIYTTILSQSLKSFNTFLVCCILSLPLQTKYDIVPTFAGRRRFRRSNKEVTPLSQREFLIRNKFGVQNSQPIASVPKIVTAGYDSADPYWNVKNSYFKGTSKQDGIKQDYSPDYVEDYVVELPRPGLVGLYSDYEKLPPSWINMKDNPNPPYDINDDYSEEDVTSFGYSTIDPRRVLLSKSQKRRRPTKITTELPEEETTLDVESQKVNFQSNPNFHVLQGFKLLNLGRPKNKFYMKNSKRSTTKSSVENDSNESLDNKSPDGEQVYRRCGKTSMNQHKKEEIGENELSEAESGSYPFLAIIVPSRRPQNVLCYATIVHPRMAITAGDCVTEYTITTSDKDILVIVTGLTDIKERSETQNRLVTIHLHPQWRRAILAHNLAILHWNSPLQFNVKVQPACLSSARDTEDCKFYGWSGFDQAVRQRVWWQKTSLISSQDCTNQFSKPMSLPSDAFCATVQSRGTVTGIGGSLICNIEGRATAVGVAVYRDNAIVLIPAHDWLLRAMQDLNIN